MTATQLAKRLSMSPQGVLKLEQREVEGDVTVSTLRKAASALNCDLVVAFIPKPSLEDTIRLQARAKAQQERNRLVHTMRLEDQERGVEESIDMTASIQAWLTTRLARLWD
jgi:predicted DNA-binding mobile mystery protein A